MKRHFYILAVYHDDQEPPEILNINQRYVHPTIFADATISPEMIPYYAERHVATQWPNTDLADLQMVAYMVTSPHTARLVWHKPAGRVRGKWADWHGNPKRKRQMTLPPSETATKQHCAWCEAEEGAYWKTSCGEAFNVDMGTMPGKGAWAHCPNCGKPIEEKGMC